MTEPVWFDAGGRLSAEIPQELLSSTEFCSKLVVAALHHFHGAAAIAALDAKGLLTLAIPEIEPMRKCEQNEFHHKPVLAHTLEAMENLDRLIRFPDEVSQTYGDRIGDSLMEPLYGLDARAVLRLAMLLHDIEKPSTKADGKEGRITFHKHDTLGAKTGAAVTNRLPGFAAASQSVETLIKQHMLLGFIARDETPNQKSISRFVKKLGALTPHEILLSISDRLAARGPKVEEENIRRHFVGAKAILKEFFEPKFMRRPFLTGAEIMEIAGISPGPKVGALMKKLRDAENSGKIKNKDEAIALLQTIIST